MARGGSGSRRAQSIVALSANRLGTHGPRPRGMCVQKQKQRTRGHYELGRIYWADVFCCMAHAHLYLLCTGDVGVFVGRGNFLSDWNLARFLSLVYVISNGRGHKAGVADVACAGDGERSFAASCG